MKYALVNPNWSFDGSIYFGCRQPHLPLEYGYAKAVLERSGHEALIVDGQLEKLSPEQMRSRVAEFRPDFIVLTTAPSYLFWRCAPPELRVPQETVRNLRGVGGAFVAIGPHASTTPRATLRKLGVEAVIMGEPEELFPALAGDWRGIPGLVHRGDGAAAAAAPHAADMKALPALEWPKATLARHRHHHHRFDAEPLGPGAEMEVSRGCPYHCTFCAKEQFRTNYRKRPHETILAELDGLLSRGVEYVYFIDEIFLPDVPLLEKFAERRFKFGVQTRIDLWKPDLLELLGRAGCVSVEAGVESISLEGRELLDKRSKLTTAEFTGRLIEAKKHIAFVQANLLDAKVDDAQEIEAWRDHLRRFGVWANKPVPLFAYPGSPEYRKRWGEPDDQAWERALDCYLRENAEFSDIQELHPLPLAQLELEPGK
jgi:anaerobic magnesium-protoporphyrin IX monomethyl ester cyclase